MALLRLYLPLVVSGLAIIQSLGLSAQQSQAVGELRTYTVSPTLTSSLPEDVPSSAENPVSTAAIPSLTKEDFDQIQPSQVVKVPSGRGRYQDSTSAQENGEESISPVISGNYAIFSLEGSSSTTTTSTTESVLLYLDRIRQLPPEEVEELPPRVPASTTESVIELLNKLRQQFTPRPVTEEPEIDNTSTALTTTLSKTTTTETTTTTTTTTATIPTTTTTTTTITIPTTSEENLSTESDTEAALSISSDMTTVIDWETIPDTTTIANIEETTTVEENTTGNLDDADLSTVAYDEKVDYPATEFTERNTQITSTSEESSLDTNTVDQASPVSTISPDTIEESVSDEDERVSSSSSQDVAILTVVGVLTAAGCLIGLIMCCVYKQNISFSRKNIYTTMEAATVSDEPAKTFTRPGPPVILQHEVNAVKKQLAAAAAIAAHPEGGSIVGTGGSHASSSTALSGSGRSMMMANEVGERKITVL